MRLKPFPELLRETALVFHAIQDMNPEQIKVVQSVANDLAHPNKDEILRLLEERRKLDKKILELANSQKAETVAG